MAMLPTSIFIKKSNQIREKLTKLYFEKVALVGTWSRGILFQSGFCEMIRYVVDTSHIAI